MGLFKKKKEEKPTMYINVDDSWSTITCSTVSSLSDTVAEPDYRLNENECVFTVLGHCPWDRQLKRLPVTDVVFVSEDKKIVVIKETIEDDISKCYRQAVDKKETVYPKAESYCVEYQWSSESSWYEEKRKTVVGCAQTPITPLDGFHHGAADSGFIMTEQEFERYLKSGVTLADWRNIKLYKRLKQFGIEDEFINTEAKRIDSLEKYKRLLMVIKECDYNPDTIKYAIKEGFTAPVAFAAAPVSWGL